MSNETKQTIIGILGFLFLASLIIVQFLEVVRKSEEAGITKEHIVVPSNSKGCVKCHALSSPGIVDHWEDSTHAKKGIGCVECHAANKGDVDGFQHEGHFIATIVTPKDCGRCHQEVAEEFAASHHAKAGYILASLDNYLAETVEGSKVPFNPHSKTPGFDVKMVNGSASVDSGCKQCHGSKVSLVSIDGKSISVDDLKPNKDGFPTNLDALAKIKKDKNGRPIYTTNSWPNTGIGRLNLDGSHGSCSACHSRHDFSPRRARQPENCGKCHLGPDHPQKEIYEESKHGVAYRDLKHKMNLDSKDWVLGKDYSAAPTCATCHMSGNSKNKGKITHDPGRRISWNNRLPVSARLDTDANGKIVMEKDPVKRRKLVVHTAEEKRNRMKDVCSNCHSTNYINSFYKQYDDLIILFNEKFSKPGGKIMKALKEQKLITKTPFDEKIEWTWFYLWHHEGRRARHGASMMAPDYTHWHGMYEVSERFYVEFVPEVEELIHEAEKNGNTEAAKKVKDVLDAVLARPEHKWLRAEKK